MRKLFTLLRIVLSLLLLAYLIWRADPLTIWAVWQQADRMMIGLALLIQFGGVALSAAKWGILLRARGRVLPFRWLLANYLVGQFANNLLPTTIGGDALRTAQLGRRIGSYSEAGASIFLERVTGFLALSLIACAALVVAVLPGGLTVAPWVAWLTGGFTLAALVALLGSAFAPQLLARFGPQLPERARRPLSKLAIALRDYLPRGGLLWLTLGLSFAFQLLWIALHLVLAAALAVPISVALYGLMVPMTDMLSLIPIFFNSLGVREAVFILYLGQLGVAEALAVALALLVFSVRLVVSLIGGIVLLFGGGDLRLAMAQPVADGERPNR